MRLERVENGHRLRQKMRLMLMRLGEYTPTDFNRTMLYRPGFFGEAFARLQMELTRGEDSQWTMADRELFCAFVSKTNGCRFCTATHGAVASELGNEEQTRAVLDDYRTAPISKQMIATLAFLEKLTLQPEHVTSDDARAVRAAGVPPRAFLRAVYICTMLNVINRLAQTLDFEVPPAATLARRAKLSVDNLRREGRIP